MADLNNDIVNNQTSESDSDEESLDSDSDNDQKPTFTIGEKTVQKSELERLIKSRKQEDVKILNQLVMTIMEDDQYRVFEYLVDHGYKAGVLNSKGQTVVHIGFYDECDRIQLRHRKKNLFSYFDDYSNSDGEILSVLLSEWMLEKSMNLKYVDCNGLSYLHVACFLLRSGDVKLISKCLKSKIDVNAQFRDPKGHYGNFTPLHFAVTNSSDESADIVAELLFSGKIKVDVKDLLDRTPLHLACRVYEDPGDFYIHNRFVNVLEKPCTLAPRIFAESHKFHNNSLQIIDLLIQSGADVNLKDKNGNTPLLSIFPENYAEFDRFDCEWHEYGVPIIETTMKFACLIKKGAKMTVSNNNGDTILHLITRNLRNYRNSSKWDLVLFDDAYHLEMIKHIFNSEQKVKVNAKNKKGEYPIQWAVESLSVDVVQLLLSHGANLNHLKFSCADDQKFFSYPNVVPESEATQNLIAITEILLANGFDLTTEIKLKILNFLVHNVKECECDHSRYLVFLYGSTSHIRQIFNKMYLYLDENMTPFTSYYYPITMGDLYADEEVIERVKKIIDEKDGSLDRNDFMEASQIQNELNLMKSIKVTDDLNLHDLMTRHPYNVPYTIAKNFDFSVLKGMKCYREIVKAHFSKTILRRFVEKMCGGSVEVLCRSLPDLCCQLIIDYLSNQDIVNVYSIVNSL